MPSNGGLYPDRQTFRVDMILLVQERKTSSVFVKGVGRCTISVISLERETVLLTHAVTLSVAVKGVGRCIMSIISLKREIVLLINAVRHFNVSEGIGIGASVVAQLSVDFSVDVSEKASAIGVGSSVVAELTVHVSVEVSEKASALVIEIGGEQVKIPAVAVVSSK